MDSGSVFAVFIISHRNGLDLIAQPSHILEKKKHASQASDVNLFIANCKERTVSKHYNGRSRYNFLLWFQIPNQKRKNETEFECDGKSKYLRFELHHVIYKILGKTTAIFSLLIFREISCR